MQINQLKLFDSHLHIIDPLYPLVPNNGYLPQPFSCNNYLDRIKRFDLAGGVVVSGSFQAFDQDYLLAALNQLGPSFVGVTQLPISTSDEQLRSLDKAGVKGLRFNLKRGGSETIQHLDQMARRVFETVGWHTELYVDSKDLDSLYNTLSKLPAISIDHLGLSAAGQKTLLQLVEKGARVKATGFGRVNFDVASVLRDIYRANPAALMFGTDLPCTRAERPFEDNDMLLVGEVLGHDGAQKVMHDNAIGFYRIQDHADVI
jgi:predicted TIM-barrel fold metal-dependent hydrolase